MLTCDEKVASFVNMSLRDHSGIRRQRCACSLATMTLLQVDWEDTQEGTLTTTTAGGMTALFFASSIWHGSSRRYTDGTWPRTHSGVLEIFESYVPPGFSGGGAYIDLPAQAINPWAGADAPGATQSLLYA